MWKQANDFWFDVGPLHAIPPRGARTVKTPRREIAVFRTASDEVFALENRCPHKGGPLSEGIVHGRKVACPLHNWIINLEDGKATGADKRLRPQLSGQAGERPHLSRHELSRQRRDTASVSVLSYHQGEL